MDAINRTISCTVIQLHGANPKPSHLVAGTIIESLQLPVLIEMGNYFKCFRIGIKSKNSGLQGKNEFIVFTSHYQGNPLWKVSVTNRFFWPF